jgi:hypothetical protein
MSETIDRSPLFMLERFPFSPPPGEARPTADETVVGCGLRRHRGRLTLGALELVV